LVTAIAALLGECGCACAANDGSDQRRLEGAREGKRIHFCPESAAEAACVIRTGDVRN
jgi:hypothetical protein